MMSMMGWSSQSMGPAAKHVTDAMRAEGAGQAGDLSWQVGTGVGAGSMIVPVRSDSLAIVPALPRSGRR